VKFSSGLRTAGVVAVAAIGLVACGSNNGASSSGSSTSGSGSSSSGGGALTPQGSTFQQTLEQQWASKYTAVKVTYSGTGSSAGIQQFTTGKIPFAGSDVTMTSAQQQQANAACGSTALSLPITSGGVAIMYNLPSVKNLKLDATTVADIFEGKIKKWNDSAIAKLNPGVTLPSTAISTFHRADGSGTTNVLSGYLDAEAGKAWTLGVNKELTWPAGQAATGSSGVAQGVKNTTGGITYAEITYAQQDGLSTAEIKSSVGSSYEAISADTVAKSITSGFSITGTGNDLAGTLSFDKMTGYPISTVSYVLVCSKYKNATEGKNVKGYLTYAAGSGQSEASALGFAPLPSDLDAKVQASVASIS
jgi:phosphate transport system substrate-binding protein